MKGGQRKAQKSTKSLAKAKPKPPLKRSGRLNPVPSTMATSSSLNPTMEELAYFKELGPPTLTDKLQDVDSKLRESFLSIHSSSAPSPSPLSVPPSLRALWSAHDHYNSQACKYNTFGLNIFPAEQVSNVQKTLDVMGDATVMDMWVESFLTLPSLGTDCLKNGEKDREGCVAYVSNTSLWVCFGCSSEVRSTPKAHYT
jgi:hypothetical protein